MNKIIYLYKYIALHILQDGNERRPRITKKCEPNNSYFLFIFSIKYKPTKHPIRSINAPKLVNIVATDFSPAS